MASEEDDEDVIYEEQEVLWAKIRGYPWWPAFVDKVHPVVKGHQAEYTVFFFGDNTNSKLGASKLRKFYQHYIEFYLKARSHRKLMTSIQMAEDKLAQNNQNVQIFQTLRNSLKAKSKGKVLNKSESLKGEFQMEDARIQLPNLVKSNTQEYVNISTNLNVEDFQVRREATKDTRNDSNINSGNAVIIIQQKENVWNSRNKKQLPSSIEQDNKIKKQEQKQQIIQQQFIIVQSKPPQQIQQPSVYKMIVESQPNIKLQSQREESIQDQSDQQIISNHKRKIINKQKSYQQRSNKAPRKRGRPKKIFDAVEHSPSLKIHPQRRIQRLKRKIIRKADREVSSQIAIQSASLSPSNSHNLQIIKKLCSNRESLIDYLSSIQITVDNVKQILDLDVSNILQDGVITQKIVNLLEMMKAALLYKYFPDDVKHRKRYRQLSKKIFIVYDDNKNEASEERDEEACQNKSQQQQIRKKTIVKLQKFLKGHSQISSQAKEMAVKIQGYFQQADNQIGQRYKTIAFKVLKSLKEKSDTCSQVIEKLDQQAYG